MKTNNLVIGIIVLVLAALLLADGVISYTDNTPLFSLGDVKGIVGFVLVVLAASYFRASKD